MKPRTKMQREVARLSAHLRPITPAQAEYAQRNCFKYIARRTAKGVITCTHCGASWQGTSYLSDSVCESHCPKCGVEIDVQTTRRRVYKASAYYAVVTTCKGYQLLRNYQVRAYCRVGSPARFSIDEVVQRWVDANGKTAVIAHQRGMLFGYYDQWVLSSPMEIRHDKAGYNLPIECVYSHSRILPKIRRNGFTGDYHNIHPYLLFSAILTDSRMETLLKAHQIALLKHFIYRQKMSDTYWSAIKICIRNGYEVSDGTIWCDYIDLLQHFGADIHNAKYVCPDDLTKAHDALVVRRRREIEREQAEKRRQRALQDEQEFLALKGKFFGLVFTDGNLSVRVLESVMAHLEEGEAMHHCVYTNRYYSRANSLIFSARIDGKRIETVEVALESMKVVQSRGVCNKNTKYHNRIISLMERNMSQIAKRMVA